MYAKYSKTYRVLRSLGLGYILLKNLKGYSRSLIRNYLTFYYSYMVYIVNVSRQFVNQELKLRSGESIVGGNKSPQQSAVNKISLQSLLIITLLQTFFFSFTCV